jgi:hypothetical protein
MSDNAAWSPENRQLMETLAHRDDRKAVTWQFSRTDVADFLQSVHLNLRIVEILQKDAGKFSVKS